MDNDSSSMIISSPKNGIVFIPDSETSDSNTNNVVNAKSPLFIRNNKKRPRNECGGGDVVVIVDNASSFPKFKGVVPQQNGNWGAQIYANHQRVWLGTFRTASLAAMAYDSAAIKLRTGDLHRNFPWTGLTLQEPQFQAHYSAEAVLAMIKDGSYQSKFEYFVRARSMTLSKQATNDRAINDAKTTTIHRARAHDNNDNDNDNNNNVSRFVTKLLFQKELTPSDVGKLNRLVIPKKFAVKYFPYISEESFVVDSDDVELVFYDKEMTPWRFRYCYWKSSQSYVFTRGWNRFVKDNKLKANDVVTFYSRDECNEAVGNGSQSFCLIDVAHHDNETIETKRGLDSNNNNNNNAERKGFRLFGVDIK